MRSADRLKARSRERAEGLAKDAAVEGLSSFVPGVGALAKWAYKAATDRRTKRTEDFFRQLLTGEGSMTEEQCRKALEREDAFSEILIRLLEDEEDEKGWAYAALFRAFADGLVPKQNRLLFLRCARELTNAELLGMRGWQPSSKPHARGPYVLFRISFATNHREWFIQPEVMQEESPHVIEVLCRWGFIKRVHERVQQEKEPDPHGIPSLSSETFPAPGASRLQVQPGLAMLVFVFANRGRGRDLVLTTAKTLSVHEEGRVDAAEYRSDTVVHVDPKDGPPTTRVYTKKATKPVADDPVGRHEKQIRVLSERLERLPNDPKEAVGVLRNIGNELNGIRTMGLSHADLEEAARKAGPAGGTVTVAGKSVRVAPPVVFKAPNRK